MQPGSPPRPPAIPQIKAWMTPFPHSISPRASLEEALRRMRENGFRHLPVQDGDQLVGVVSDRDIECALGSGGGSAEGAARTVREVAVEPFAVDLSAPADRVLLEMAERHIGSALVTRQGKLVGIFTVTDACRCFGRFLQRQFGSGPGDEVA